MLMEKYFIFFSGFILGYAFNQVLNTNNNTKSKDPANKYRNNHNDKKRHHV
jgi:hypothetical protein